MLVIIYMLFITQVIGHLCELRSGIKGSFAKESFINGSTLAANMSSVGNISDVFVPTLIIETGCISKHLAELKDCSLFIMGNYIMADPDWIKAVALTSGYGEKVAVYGKDVVINAYIAVYQVCHGIQPATLPPALCVDFSPAEVVTNSALAMMIVTPIFIFLFITAVVGISIWQHYKKLNLINVKYQTHT